MGFLARPIRNHLNIWSSIVEQEYFGVTSQVQSDFLRQSRLPHQFFRPVEVIEGSWHN